MYLTLIIWYTLATSLALFHFWLKFTWIHFIRCNIVNNTCSFCGSLEQDESKGLNNWLWQHNVSKLDSFVFTSDLLDSLIFIFLTTTINVPHFLAIIIRLNIVHGLTITSCPRSIFYVSNNFNFFPIFAQISITRTNQESVMMNNTMDEPMAPFDVDSIQLFKMWRLFGELTPIFTRTHNLRRSARVRGLSLEGTSLLLTTELNKL